MTRGRTCSGCGSARPISVLGPVANEVAPCCRSRRRSRSDYILCQITSKPYGDTSAIELDDGAFASGSLRVLSYARPAKLFTANENLIASQVGNLKAKTLRRVTRAVTEILKAGKVP